MSALSFDVLNGMLFPVVAFLDQYLENHIIPFYSMEWKQISNLNSIFDKQ